MTQPSEINYTDAEVAWFAAPERAEWAGVDPTTGKPFLCACGGEEHVHDLRNLAAKVGEHRWRLACDLLKAREAIAAAYQRGRESMVEEFKRWEMAIRTEEREQCAQRCEAVERDNPAFDERDKGFCEAATECARAIREGGR